MLCLISTFAILVALNLTTFSELKPTVGPNEVRVTNNGETNATLSSVSMDISEDIKESDAFYPVDSGQEGAYWPIIPDEHWNFMPRVYPPWNSTTHSWCGDEADYDFQTRAGLIYAKVHKAASSTLSGITLRVAENYGRRRRPNHDTGNDAANMTASACAVYYKHGVSDIFHKRDRSRSFMFSSIRHPASRAMSWIFYYGSVQGGEMTEMKVLLRLRSRNYYPMRSHACGAQVGYMHTAQKQQRDLTLWSDEEPSKVHNLSLSTSRVADVMSQYDLIMIVERLHESLVVLQLMLGINTSDILYLSAKQSGQYSYMAHPFPGCHLIAKSFMTPDISAFLSSPTWYAQNYEDYLLYKAANRSLDMTIDRLGRRRFEKALAKYENMMEAAKICDNETVTACTSEGVHVNETDCYRGQRYSDMGCGYPCLDRRFGT